MDKFFLVQMNILRAVSESLLTYCEKQDIFNYLFWNLAWDFDIDKYSKSLVDVPKFEQFELDKDKVQLVFNERRN